MAHTLTSAFDMMVLPFAEAVAKGLGPLDQLGVVTSEDVVTKRLVLIEETGDETAFTDETSAISFSEVKASTKDFSVTDAVKGFKFSWGQFQDFSPAQIANLGTQLGARAAARCAAAFYTMLEALDSTAHPQAGAGAGQVGGGKMFFDTGLAGNQTLGTAFSWSNLLHDVLSEGSIKSAISLMLQQRAYSGEYVQPDLGSLVLICHPDYAFDAMRIAKSAALGIDNGINTLFGMFNVHPYPLADADAWYLIDPAAAPVQLWVRQRPDLIVSESQEHTHVFMTSRRRAAGTYGLTAHGIVASIP